MEKKESRMYMKKKEKKQSIYNEGRLLKLTCDHKVEDSLAIEVMDNDKLSVKCKLCGARFSIKPMGENEVHDAAKLLTDALNCIKLKGEYGSNSSLPFETRKQIAVTLMFLDSLPEFYKEYYLDNLEGNNMNSDRYESNGPCEVRTDGGLILGNNSNWKKHNKHRDVEDFLGLDRQKKKKHYNDRDDRDYRGNKNKNHKNKNGNKKKKNDRDDWGY